VSLPVSPVTLLIALGVWLVATAATLAIAAMIVVKLPPTYFSEDSATHAVRVGSWRSPRHVTRNALGVVLVALGLAMSIPGIPGQGLLTMLIGLMLVDFPGRRRLEKALVRRPGILAAINRMRARFGHPPLLPPAD
jgi:hypothetical protein